MIEGRLSRRYTKALFQLAREAGAEEKIGQEIEQFFCDLQWFRFAKSPDQSGLRRPGRARKSSPRSRRASSFQL